MTGDPTVVDVVNRGKARYVADLPAAVAFLEELRDAYLSHYRRELQRKATRR